MDTPNIEIQEIKIDEKVMELTEEERYALKVCRYIKAVSLGGTLSLVIVALMGIVKGYNFLMIPMYIPLLLLVIAIDIIKWVIKRDVAQKQMARCVDEAIRVWRDRKRK